MSLSAGTRFGAYEILSLIGAGGMGEVYRARDRRLRRDVAIKILPSQFTHDDDIVRRFEQEAFAASSLNHPNILTIFESGEHDGQRFIVTELVEGDTLRAVLKQTGRIGVKDALSMAGQVAGALSAAHTAGIVHRDIKPENVMLRPDGYVKVLDFGIAKLLPDHTANVDAETMTDRHARTTAGALVGTLPYMSPEQARGATVDARSDVWSLGCLLYEMLTGTRAFDGETTTDLLVAIVDREPPPVSQLTPSATAECDWIVGKMLRKNPAERYQSAGELLGDLRRLQDNIGSAKQGTAARTNPVASNSPRPSRLLMLAASLAAIAMLGGAAWYLSPATLEAHSLAVLPLKSLNASDDYLGLGIADAVIRKTSQTGGIVVRPTSAVRRYASGDTDALAAARELGTDAVLEGNVQRIGDQLRVSVNLLRARDGVSLWADNFDLHMTDIFTIEDSVAQQVASHLRLTLDSAQQARASKRPTSDSLAYEYYLKALQVFDQRLSLTDSQRNSVNDLLNKAIELDPAFAQAHALLAYSLATNAVFQHTPSDVDEYQRAKAEITRAQALEPDLPDIALARFQLLASRFEGFQLATAVKVVRNAQHIDPSMGYDELGYLYSHLGLADEAERALTRALQIDPASAFAQALLVDLQDWGKGDYGRWLELHNRFQPSEPITPWYYLGTGRLDDAQRALDSAPPGINTAERGDASARLVLSAMRGDGRRAEASIPALLAQHAVKDPLYHHDVAAVAFIYAIDGKSADAVHWLREADAAGFSPYPMYKNSRLLNRIRSSPDFMQFMSELQTRIDGYRREFAF